MFPQRQAALYLYSVLGRARQRQTAPGSTRQHQTAPDSARQCNGWQLVRLTCFVESQNSRYTHRVY